MVGGNNSGVAMLLSFWQKREILRAAVNAASIRATEGRGASDARATALAVVDAAIAAQERIVEKDGSIGDRLLLGLRKARHGMLESQ